MILLAALLLQAQPAVFAPAPGTPYRITTDRTDRGGKAEQHFHVERLVRFTRDEDGWRAEVRVTKVDAGDSAETGAVLQAGYAGLSKRVLIFHLDGSGKIVALDDAEAIWRDFCAGLTRSVAMRKRDGSSETKQRIVTMLAAMPPAQQLATLAPMAGAMIAPEAFDPPGTAPVRQPGASPLGAKLVLTGTRTVTHGPLTHSSTGTASDFDGGHIDSATERDSDPATGLLIASSETITTRVEGQPETRKTTRITVTPLAAEAWPK